MRVLAALVLAASIAGTPAVARALCAIVEMGVRPAPGTTIPLNPRFVLTRSGSGAERLERDLDGLLWLEADGRRVPLRVVERATGDIQVMLEATATLEPGERYLLASDDRRLREAILRVARREEKRRLGREHGLAVREMVRELDRQHVDLAWVAGAAADTSPPTWDPGG
jgi:hypothetical protein